MSMVRPKGKHLSRITIDDVAFYYAKECKVLPLLHAFYISTLTSLESQGKLCFTPAAILERYHLNFRKRAVDKAKKVAQ